MSEAFIPYSTQDIDDADIAAVVAAMKHPFITQGPAIERFETCVAGYCDAPHAVAVSSGTAGLHVAMAALDIGPRSRVWAPPITFVATTNVALLLGASVSFVDIDIATGNLDIPALEAKLAEARNDGALPDLLVVVHFAGRPCDMAAIHALCQPHGIAIVEDAAHALGARHDDGPNVGHAHFSQACVFSFHPVKSITTGEGGLVTTRNAALARRMRRLRSHGNTRDATEFVETATPTTGAWYYQQLELGYNYRMTDIQAALGTSQMQRLNGFIADRRARAHRYAGLLEGLPLTLPPDSESSAWHLYVVRLAEHARLSRHELFDVLRSAKIGVNVHYIPVHLQPYYAGLGFRPGDYPASESFYDGILSLPLYPRLTDAQQDFVAATLRNALG